MTRHIVRVLTVVVGSAMWFAGVAQAQYVPHWVKVRVPFEFTFQDRQFAAGDYLVVCTPITAELRTPQGETVATGIPHSVESRTLLPAKLSFTSEDGVHVLSQIWPGNSPVGYEFAPSKRSTLVAKQRSTQQVEGAGGGNK